MLGSMAGMQTLTARKQSYQQSQGEGFDLPVFRAELA
jgi:hypothetical protein